MESSIAGNLPKNAQALARDVGSKLSETVGRAQAMGRQGFDAVSDAAQRAQEIASDTSDSIIRYTRKNPAKALLIAAAAGALLLSVVQMLKSSRD